MACERSVDASRDIEYTKFSLLSPFLLLAPDVSAGRTARELWSVSKELSSVGIIITMALHAHISSGDEQ
jgi:hypothetical protein